MPNSLDHLSTSLNLTLSLGTVGGEAITKSVTVSKIKASMSADNFASFVTKLGDCFAHSIAAVKVRETSVLSTE